jgi:hypothetical protein
MDQSTHNNTRVDAHDDIEREKKQPHWQACLQTEADRVRRTAASGLLGSSEELPRIWAGNQWTERNRPSSKTAENAKLIRGTDRRTWALSCRGTGTRASTGSKTKSHSRDETQPSYAATRLENQCRVPARDGRPQLENTGGIEAHKGIFVADPTRCCYQVINSTMNKRRTNPIGTQAKTRLMLSPHKHKKTKQNVGEPDNENRIFCSIRNRIRFTINHGGHYPSFLHLIRN